MTTERYIRQLPIVGEGGQQTLAQKRILIVGCGGLGGHLLENMLRIGVGTITAVDGDRFEESNLNRQLLSVEPLLGCSKAEAAADRAQAVNSEVAFHPVPEPLTRENGDALVEGCDLVLDGLDNVPDRLLLEEICAKHEVPLVHGAILGDLVQVAVVPPGSGMLRMLYGNAPASGSKASIAYTPACCAAIQCAQATQLLLGREPSLWGKLMQMDLETMTEDVITFL
ncbi:MAG: ThiF family adenylyltransferase [Mogibacterium sp.]|nr:ThiF family adenylyltransferase [Mogibacterium sp.]